jgi:hypothetical protein
MSFKNIIRAVVYGIVKMGWRLDHVLVRFVTHPQRDVVHWAWTDDSRSLSWRRIRMMRPSALAEPCGGAEIIYAPSCIDFHPEHVRVAKVVATLVRDDQTIRVYEIGVPLTRHLVNIVANIEHVARKKTSQLELYGSQIDAIRPLKRIHKYGKAYYGLGAIEKFWQVSGGACRRIMAEGNWLDRVRSPCRGIRQNPISDPLSVLIGRQDRLRLKKLSTSL